MARPKVLHMAMSLLIGSLATLSSTAPQFNPTTAISAPNMPKFDNSSISCHSTTISGLSFDDIKYFASQACPDFRFIHDAQSSPKISRIRSGGGQEVTFQLDYSFESHRRGSNFSLGYDACMEGFTYALLHCDDKDGDLYQNGLVHATFETVPMTFLTSIVESGGEKRGDHYGEDQSDAMPSPVLLTERSSSTQISVAALGKQDLWDATGFVFFDKIAYECSNGTESCLCCAKGPWIPTSQAENLPKDFCGWATEGSETKTFTPMINPSNHGPPGLVKYSLWNAFNKSQPLSRTQCELWVDRLTSTCTTAAAGFTGGSLTIRHFQFLIKVTGAEDDDGVSLRRDLDGEYYEVPGLYG